MRRHNQLDQAALTRCGKRLHVAIENRLEGLLLFHSGCSGAHGLYLVERKGKLNIHRVFAPQRAVIIEGRYPLRHRNKTGRTFAGHGGDKIQDRLLRLAVSPRRKRISLRQRRSFEHECRCGRDQKARQHCTPVNIAVHYTTSNSTDRGLHCWYAQSAMLNRCRKLAHAACSAADDFPSSDVDGILPFGALGHLRAVLAFE